MQEIWKPIEGYEGRYEISSYGRVKSYLYDKVNGRILKGSSSRGYPVIILYDENCHKRAYLLHRIVAKTFIDNPNNLPEVNHIDEDKTNNRVDNLEWCTSSYNVNYGNRNDTVARKNINHPSKSTPVFSIDMDGNINFYKSVSEAERQTGISHGNIVRALKGHTPRCGKRYWYYSITTPIHIANND